MHRRTKISFLLGSIGIAVAVGAAAFLQLGLVDLNATAADQPSQEHTVNAIPVEAVTIERNSVRLWRSFSARLQAVDEVKLRPQVSGTIVEIRFQDGQTVAKDDVLFVIDPRPFKAAAAQMKADLAGARERLSFAERELDRARQLIRSSTVSKRVLDQRENDFANAKSDVQAAAARLTQAEIDLDRAYVKAPISGRVSRAEITVGNLVRADSNPPVLTTIVSDKGIYADFDVDEGTYLRYARASGGEGGERSIPVQLAVGPGGEASDYEGYIHAFDNQIDPQTGTIRARALFENTDKYLLPGMFAKVRMGAPAEQEVVLLSERAILTDQDRKFVYVVDADSKASYREVQLGDAVSGRRVITDGLVPGDKVIVSGTMIVRPNTPVAPQNVVRNADDSLPTRVAAGG